MRTFRLSLRGRLFALCLPALFWIWAPAVVRGEEGDPGDTPPLPTSTSTMVWEYVSALWANPDTANAKIGANWIHRETDSWYHHSESFGVSPLGGSAFHAPVAVAAGRTLDLTRDWYTTAAYTATASGNVVEVRNENGSTVHLDAGNGVSAPRRYGDLVLLAADVDGLVEADDSYHDEILVLYDRIQDGVETLRLTVLKHDLTVLAQTDVTNPAPVFLDGPCADMAAGDLDGDGLKEIAVGTQWFNAAGNSYYARLTAFRYQDGSLQAGASGQFDCPSYYHPHPVSLASGDFNGDGVEDLFGGTSVEGNYTPYLVEGYTFDALLTPTRRCSPYVNFNYPLPYGSMYFTPADYRIHLAAGWFKDPGTTDLPTRRQLAVASAQPDSMNVAAVNVALEVLDFDAAWSTAGGGLATIYAYDVDHYYTYRPDDIKLLPGNFYGTLNTVPFQDLGVFITQLPTSTSTRDINFVACKVDRNSLTVSQPYIKWNDVGILDAAFPGLGVARMDDGGRSVLLGPPIQLVMEDVVTPDYTIEEPPKHLDYLPVDPQDPTGEWAVVNLSRYDEFSCAYTQSGEQSVTHTGQSKAEGGAGLSAGLGIDMSVKANEILVKEKLDVSLDASIKFAFQRAVDTTNTQYNSYSYKMEHATDHDDILQYEARTYKVWRYPIYGYTALNPNTNQEAQGFYDVNFPPTSALTTFIGGLGCSDFYQPVHQNGNVLSYPLQASHPYAGDLGSFTLPGSSTPVTDFLNDTSLAYGVDGSAKTLDIEWTQKAGSEQQKSWSESLSGDLDFKMSFTVKELFFGKQTIDFNASLQADGNWSQITTDDKETSTTKGLTINVPAFPGLNSSQIYTFTPYAYFSTAGNSKVQHAVTLPGTSSWWNHQYGRLPDPGLNLPNHFLVHKNPYTGEWDDWEVDESTDGKRVRGLFIRTGEAAAATGDPMDVTHSVVDGAALTVTARVYNFSLLQCTTPFDVLFEYVPVNPVTDTETGPRVAIGSARVSALGPLGMQEVTVPWNTTGLGPATPDTCSTYRIWVTVDPGGAVEAIHPHGSVCDNKEGYWPWNGGVSVWSALPAARTAAAAEEFRPRMQLGLRQPDGTLHTGWGTAPEGENAKLSALIVADAPDRRTLHVVFYDWVLFSEIPQKALAHKLVQGVSWHGHVLGHAAYANLDWRPLEPGVHFIRAQFANTSLPYARTDFPPEDFGANLLVWVPSGDAGKDLETAGRSLENLEAERPRIVALGGEDLFHHVRASLSVIEARTRARIQPVVPSRRRVE
ncbi:MAG: VCBS repeat-containing protein [Acidobacteria bacterium]|nr:VCBS repeat-containing protein [Acidobacteriota bacterium]